MTTPTLTTPRLILRAHTAADFPACRALWSNPDVTRFIGGRPSTGEEVWRRIMTYAGHWQLKGYGYFLAETRDTGTLVGEFGLADFHRDITPPLGDTPEAGWAMLPQFHGHGLAHKALTAVLRLGRPVHAPHRLPDRPGQHPVTETGDQTRLYRIRPDHLQGRPDDPAGAAPDRSEPKILIQKKGASLWKRLLILTNCDCYG